MPFATYTFDKKFFSNLNEINFNTLPIFITDLKDFNLNQNLSHIFLVLSIIYIFSYSFFHPYGNGTILNNLVENLNPNLAINISNRVKCELCNKKSSFR